MALKPVTICLGTWNASRFVEQTLRSIQAQTYPQLHILIADDASGDATLETCAAILGDDPRVHLIQRLENIGWCRNYSDMLERVETAYVCFAFHDDRLEPEYIAQLVAALEEQPSAVLAYSDLTFGVNQFVPLSGIYRQLDRVDHPTVRLRSLIRMQGSWWIPFRGVARTESAKRCIDSLRVDREESFSSDWIWLIRMAMLGSFVRVPRNLVQKNWLRSGVTSMNRWEFNDDLKLRNRCLQELAQQRPVGWRQLMFVTRIEIVLLPMRRCLRRLRWWWLRSK
jgi:glycosyltransferase involved in cell wall biosynthesis